MRDTSAFSAVAFLFVLVLLLAACTPGGDANDIDDEQSGFECEQPVVAADGDTGKDELVTPEKSTFFATVSVEETSTYNTPSDGDLWPAAWSDDGRLYAANGDGKGFDLSGEWADIVVNRIEGDPEQRNIRGIRLAAGDQVGPIWGEPHRYNRKPTGMISVNGDLYLAVQDLKHGHRAFDDAPAATILKSTNKGESWTWDDEAPMFDDYQFTTIIFLDYGRDGAHNPSDRYVYAYGLDHNWRDSFSDTVPDPTKLYLARVPRDSIQDRDTWEFFAGDLAGNAEWTEPGALEDHRPVLVDERRVYVNPLVPNVLEPKEMSVLSQGSVVYNAPLDRYIYTSWTEYTFEFYEAPNPWGPWKRFFSKDFGIYPWREDSHGGYATVIPSKYISEDGREMWMNANTFVGGITNYNFSLRRLSVTPYEPTTPENEPGDENLALPEHSQDVTPVTGASIHFGNVDIFNDGNKTASEDSWNGEAKTVDCWGYTWSRAYNMNTLVYTTGEMFDDGGWFEDDLIVQVRREHEWKDVSNLEISPDYPADETAGSNATYTLSFNDTWGDGVRIIGTPGGKAKFTSLAELEVYFR